MLTFILLLYLNRGYLVETGLTAENQLTVIFIDWFKISIIDDMILYTS